MAGDSIYIRTPAICTNDESGPKSQHSAESDMREPCGVSGSDMFVSLQELRKWASSFLLECRGGKMMEQVSCQKGPREGFQSG